MALALNRSSSLRQLLPLQTGDDVKIVGGDDIKAVGIWDAAEERLWL
jgi:hypothetical protein